MPLELPEISGRAKAANFGAVYAAQWAFYLASQSHEIDSYGSFENWIKYPLRPHYDKDSFDYNLIKHTYSGNLYYLFYRSQGYTEQSAFVWTYISSLAFEFTIETVTERPSLQDIYQTPVFGTVLGYGAERLSRELHSHKNWFSRGLAYLINPFSILPNKPLFSGINVSDRGLLMATAVWDF